MHILPYRRAHALSFPGWCCPCLTFPFTFKRPNVRKPNANTDTNGNDNDNGKVKTFFDSFSSFVSPLNFFSPSFISFHHSLCVRVCGAVYCVTTTNRITEDDGTIRPMMCICVSIRPFHVQCCFCCVCNVKGA